MLENLQRTSTPHIGLQPNSQVKVSKTTQVQTHKHHIRTDCLNGKLWFSFTVFTYFLYDQIGEEMSQNSFIKQYLAKQQELLRQRLEREAREAYETNGMCFFTLYGLCIVW